MPAWLRSAGAFMSAASEMSEFSSHGGELYPPVFPWYVLGTTQTSAGSVTNLPTTTDVLVTHSPIDPNFIGECKLVGPARGTRAISIIVAGVSAGTVVGLPAGLFLGNLLGWRGTFAATAGAALVIVAAQAAVLPSIAPDGSTTARDLTGVLALPFARLGLMASAVVFIGQFSASTYITPFLLDHAHLHSGLVSCSFVGYGCGGILGALIGGRLVARSLVGSFAGSALAVAVLLLGLSFAGYTVWLVCILVVAWGLAWGIMPLAAQVWMLQAVPGAQEAASAVNVTNLQVSIAVGSALGGTLVDSASLRTVYITAASITLAAGLLATTFGEMRPKP